MYIFLFTPCATFFSSCCNPYLNALKIQITTAEICEGRQKNGIRQNRKTSCNSSNLFSYSLHLLLFFFIFSSFFVPLQFLLIQYCVASKWNLVSCVSHSLLVLTLCVFARITLKNLLRITQTLDLSMCGRREENAAAAFSSTSSENNQGSLTNHLPGRNK